MKGSAPTDLPDWRALEDRIVLELRTGIDALASDHPDAEIAFFVLWADPYKGWYEVLADTRAHNEAGALARRARMRALTSELAARPRSWKTAMSSARQLAALTYDPTFCDFDLADDPVHAFEVSYEPFLRTERYGELNVAGEDGWLEGHVRFVIAAALWRLVDEGAFSKLRRAPILRVGYAYPDSGDALVVAILGEDEPSPP